MYACRCRLGGFIPSIASAQPGPAQHGEAKDHAESRATAPPRPLYLVVRVVLPLDEVYVVVPWPLLWYVEPLSFA